MATSCWVADGDAWYRVDGKGPHHEGSGLHQNKDIYYLGKDGKMVTNDWYQNKEGKWYYHGEVKGS